MNDFLSALATEEQDVLDAMNSGFTLKEIPQRCKIGYSHLTTLRQSIQQKAVAYL